MADTSYKLVDHLFDALSRRKVSVPKFSQISGIPKDRIYKWRQQGTNPKASDVKKITEWLNGEEVDKNPNLDEIFKREGRFASLYIESLQEQKRILEVQNDFLRRNFETSLNSIAETQHAAHSQLKALSWYQALVSTGGDETKAEEALVRMNNKAAWYAGVGESAGNEADGGKSRKTVK